MDCLGGNDMNKVRVANCQLVAVQRGTCLCTNYWIRNIRFQTQTNIIIMITVTNSITVTAIHTIAQMMEC